MLHSNGTLDRICCRFQPQWRSFSQGAGESYKAVEYCLYWVHGKACLGEPNRIHKIYEIESLFQEMYAHVGQNPSKAGLVKRLTESDWDYEPNTKWVIGFLYWLSWLPDAILHVWHQIFKILTSYTQRCKQTFGSRFNFLHLAIIVQKGQKCLNLP